LISIVVMISCISHVTFRLGAPDASWSSPAQPRCVSCEHGDELVNNASEQY
jgi:hypothetical protein